MSEFWLSKHNFLYLGDANIFFNIHQLGMISWSPTSVIYDKLVALLKRCREPIEELDEIVVQIDPDNEWRFISLEYVGENHFNLHIDDGMVIIFNLSIPTLLNLAEFLEKEKNHDAYKETSTD